MSNQPQPKILTEEELKKLEWLNQNSFQLEYNAIEDLINSHRLLLSANAELSFKNQKYKNGLEEIKRNVHPEGWIKTLVDEALEELK